MKMPLNNQIRVTAGIAAIAAVMILAVGNSAQAQDFNVPSADHNVHIFPTTDGAHQLDVLTPPGGLPPGGSLTLGMMKFTAYEAHGIEPLAMFAEFAPQYADDAVKARP